MPRILQATITPSSLEAQQFCAFVTGTFDDGHQEVILKYFDDEISYQPADFIGCTPEEVRLRHQQSGAVLLRL